jgi:hypothetical protein
MQSFKLVLDPESVERRGNQPAVGRVYAEFAGKAFPEKEWSDFALVFLRDYMEAVEKLRTRARSSVSFFEGPYEIRFHRLKDRVEVSAIQRGQGKDSILHKATVPYTELLEHSMQAILPWVEHEQAVATR